MKYKLSIVALSCLYMYLTIAPNYAQRTHSFTPNIGYGLGLLEGRGVSFSLHYAYKPYNIFQFETQLFADQIKGDAFLTGNDLHNVQIGIAAGMRWNILPYTSYWRPSIYIMPGYGFATSVDEDDDFVIAVGFSNTFNQRHTLTLGANLTHYLLLLKYGYTL